MLCLDCGFNILDPIKEQYPDRVINTGCREQATVSMAAGMASEGMTVFVYSIASFLIFRALEQLRVDLVHTGLPVRLYGAGDTKFAKLGRAHCTSTEDIDVCDAIGLKWFEPPDLDLWLDYDGPSYLRLS
jgi:transketolase